MTDEKTETPTEYDVHLAERYRRAMKGLPERQITDEDVRRAENFRSILEHVASTDFKEAHVPDPLLEKLYAFNARVEDEGETDWRSLFNDAVIILGMVKGAADHRAERISALEQRMEEIGEHLSNTPF